MRLILSVDSLLGDETVLACSGCSASHRQNYKKNRLNALERKFATKWYITLFI